MTIAEMAKVIIITVAMLVYLRTFIFLLSVAHSKDSVSGGNVLDIEAELKQLEKIRMAREKQRSMR